MEKVLGVDVPPREEKKEPVLDVPAIDMTDTATGRNSEATETSDIPASKPTSRRSSKEPSRGAKRSPAGAKNPPASGRGDSVARETFQAVEALVKDGRSKTDAFNAVAEKTGRNPGTVAANYYRAARSHGPQQSRRERAVPQKEPRPAKAAAGSTASRTGSTPSGTDIDRLTTELVRSVEALADAVKQQGREVADLRDRLDRVRSVLS